MKTSGIIRHIDELGRIVIPKEMRRTLEIAAEDPIEILVEGDNIRLKKYQSACVFCGSTKDIISYRNKNVCSDCAKALSTEI